MSELKSCRVSYKDVDGVTHSVQVTASSLYEAAALGLKALQTAEWSEAPAGSLAIVVSPPAVKHQVPVTKLISWLRVVRSPRDQILKSRLRELLGIRD